MSRTFKVSGGSAWAREIRFSMDARPPEESEANRRHPSSIKLLINEEQRRMMLALLVNTPAKDSNQYLWQADRKAALSVAMALLAPISRWLSSQSGSAPTSKRRCSI